MKYTGKHINPKGGLQYILRVHPLLRGPARYEMTMEPKSNYKLLFMSRQTLSREVGTGQLCGEPASSVCVPASGAAVSTEPAGGLLGSHSEEQLTISIVIWDSSSLPERLGEEMGASGEETLARSCMWS